MLESVLEGRGSVTFPKWRGERVYMQAITPGKPMPNGLGHWRDTVDQMLAGIDAPGPVYLMVDQAIVLPGDTHRRPGVHIDGYWNPGLSTHSNGGGGHGPAPSHRPWSRHYPTPRHSSGAGSWNTATFEAPEGIILATDVEASRGFVGKYTGPIGDMGDCSQVNLEALMAVPMKAGQVYAGNVNMLHESLPVLGGCQRTVVRLNVPGWTPTTK